MQRKYKAITTSNVQLLELQADVIDFIVLLSLEI